MKFIKNFLQDIMFRIKLECKLRRQFTFISKIRKQNFELHLSLYLFMIGGKIGLSVLSRMVNRICATEQKILVLVKYLLTLTLKSKSNPSFQTKPQSPIFSFKLPNKPTNLNVSVSLTALQIDKQLKIFLFLLFKAIWLFVQNSFSSVHKLIC